MQNICMNLNIQKQICKICIKYALHAILCSSPCNDIFCGCRPGAPYFADDSDPILSQQCCSESAMRRFNMWLPIDLEGMGDSELEIQVPAPGPGRAARRKLELLQLEAQISNSDERIRVPGRIPDSGASCGGGGDWVERRSHLRWPYFWTYPPDSHLRWPYFWTYPPEGGKGSWLRRPAPGREGLARVPGPTGPQAVTGWLEFNFKLPESESASYWAVTRRWLCWARCHKTGPAGSDSESELVCIGCEYYNRVMTWSLCVMMFACAGIPVKFPESRIWPMPVWVVTTKVRVTSSPDFVMYEAQIWVGDIWSPIDLG